MVFAPLHMIKAGVGRLRRPAFDARATVELGRFGLPFFPATRFALAPSALLTVVNDVMINNRQIIVELGSGYSSLYLAKALQAQGTEGGAVITVDAEKEWLDQVMDHARACGCEALIKPVHAPLEPLQDGTVWYDPEPIKQVLGSLRIDLLLVDGPVASGRHISNARAPAVPQLKSLMNDRCAIYLDDVHRPSHAEIAMNWGKELGLKFSEQHARGGFAIASRGEGFDPIM